MNNKVLLIFFKAAPVREYVPSTYCFLLRVVVMLCPRGAIEANRLCMMDK